MSEDYKESVRLPKTDFAMKANLKDLEAKVLKSWQDENIYQKIRSKRAGKIKFVLHDGPPYANGHIHLGTSLNKILKDILIKGYTLMGYDAPYVPGWDCHGLPIEWKVEEGFKAAGKSKEEVSKVEFRKECRDFASGWIDIQKEEFKQLGVIGDFENPYLTMDFKSEAIILSEIYKFLAKGNIYLGKKPVMWSVIEKTALAEAEVEYKDKVSDIAYVAFPITNFSKSSFIGAKAVIWTTTPWTLPANRALAYSKDMDYSLIKVTKASENEKLENQKLVVAKELLEEFIKNVKIEDFEELDTSKGLEGLIAEHPLYSLGYSYKVKALEANFVENNVGTGIVHIAPAYGEQDFYLGKKNDLNLEDIINDEGIYKDSVKLFAKNHIFKASALVLEKIEECSNLIVKSKLKHSYPHSWRSKAPLIYRLTSQIFLNLDKNEIRDKALEAIDHKIKFFPESGKNRLHSMVKQRPDWCLSRQRVWGVPIAVFIHKETENILVDDEVNKKIVEAFNKKGADSWFLEDPLNFLPEKYNKNDYKAVMDVIDVWFDSGSTHAFVLKERKELKPVADVYLEGSDQHRGWFQSSLIEGIGSYDEIPYRNLVTHGFVLDKNGQKMSKSLGNTIMPLEVIDKYGADILRLWVATSNYKEDVRVSDEILKQQVDYYRKIRNTLKYLLSNLDTIDSKNVDIKYDEVEELEKYILHKLFVLNEEFVETFKNNYDYHILFNSIYNFCSLDLSSFYFDIRKDALYCDEIDSNKVKSAIFTIDIIFDYLIKWLAPFISFTAEEAYRHRYKTQESIFLDNFKVIDERFYNLSVETKWDQIKLIRKLVTESLEQERANKVIGSSLEAAPVVYLDGYNMDIIKTIDFSEVCITSNIILEDIDNLKETSGIFKDNSLKGVAVKFEKHEGVKCPRCWKKNNDNNEEGLCDRCFGVLGRKK